MNPFFLDTPLGSVSIDASTWEQIFNLPPQYIVGALFVIVGWIAVWYVLFTKAVDLFKHMKAHQYEHTWNWIVLAVDIPPLFIQTPKAVEQIFVQLTGAITPFGIKDKYWYGKEQKYFSFEIISIEGYIQFLVRTEAEYRDLVEAAIYAQYAEAEITEVEDYVNNIPDKYPNSEYDVMGVEFKLAQHEAYPIRTYPSFEYNISKDQVFSDPMAAILETFSRIGHGENFWLQLIIEPISNDWKEEGIELVKEIITGKKEHHTPWFLEILWFPMKMLGELMKPSGEGHDEGHKEEPEGKLSDLTPGVKNTVEAIEDKISKIGFESKIQALYAAHKTVFNPKKCVQGFIGAMNQFHILSRNAIVPQGLYAGSKEFVEAFKKRKLKFKAKPYVLNIEELATVWHFPLPFVKTPLVQKAGAKRAEPPLGLPVEFSESPLRKKGQNAVPQSPAIPQSLPPEELPFG